MSQCPVALSDSGSDADECQQESRGHDPNQLREQQFEAEVRRWYEGRRELHHRAAPWFGGSATGPCGICSETSAAWAQGYARHLKQQSEPDKTDKEENGQSKSEPHPPGILR